MCYDWRNGLDSSSVIKAHDFVSILLIHFHDLLVIHVYVQHHLEMALCVSIWMIVYDLEIFKAQVEFDWERVKYRWKLAFYSVNLEMQKGTCIIIEEMDLIAPLSSKIMILCQSY